MDGWMTVPEVAEEMGVSTQTVRNWIRSGSLGAVQVAERGAYRVPSIEIEFFRERAVAAARRPRPIKTRDVTTPEAFFQARIRPVLESTGESSAESLIARMRDDYSLSGRFPRFARDYAWYASLLAEQLEAVSV